MGTLIELNCCAQFWLIGQKFFSEHTAIGDFMILSAKSWFALAAFQAIFGLVVFVATRAYHIQEPDRVVAPPVSTAQPAPAWPENVSETEIARLSSPAMNQSSIHDPAEISRLADKAFGDKQYDQAADMYEKLLSFDPDNADIKNNLGLTLHYLDRSAEAIRVLNDGLVVDAAHQRTWLTLGFVNRQLGNTEQARIAFETAVAIDGNDSIRQSALKMLEELR